VFGARLGPFLVDDAVAAGVEGDVERFARRTFRRTGGNRASSESRRFGRSNSKGRYPPITKEEEESDGSYHKKERLLL